MSARFTDRIINMFQAESNTRIEKLESEMKMLSRNGENEKVNLTRKLEKMTDEVKQLKQDLFDKKQVGSSYTIRDIHAAYNYVYFM